MERKSVRRPCVFVACTPPWSASSRDERDGPVSFTSGGWPCSPTSPLQAVQEPRCDGTVSPCHCPRSAGSRRPAAARQPCHLMSRLIVRTSRCSVFCSAELVSCPVSLGGFLRATCPGSRPHTPSQGSGGVCLVVQLATRVSKDSVACLPPLVSARVLSFSLARECLGPRGDSIGGPVTLSLYNRVPRECPHFRCPVFSHPEY